MRHSFRAALSAAILALFVTLVPAVPAQAQSVENYQKQARSVTNAKRVQHDRVKLRKNKCLQRFARNHAKRMANQERMFHQDLGPVMRQCDLTSAGENVAYGFRTGRSVVNAWMNSSGHRRNILRPRFRLMGLAMRRSDNGTPYAVQVFGSR
ncbi:CAP domain-containing protein [Nocardioides coralli]|uniref:CAP domain-containing protein n=1 Tax=Nocardioides coralli TaxID=2872154 RepID=UPI001CA39BAD|nr:CAP domain-containing protein [Nocardioides coralli]QZY28421.1 hypothetical protein K6T13_13220 [Nocardioides coralli]